MRVTAPAKVNLTLRVVGKRPDGYHEIESVMQMVSLADTLTFDSQPEGITFTCSDSALAGDDNLVVRAARMLLSRSAIPRGARIHLEKHIPTQAGLGGGSSDAAATLSALNELWDLRLMADDLSSLGAQLGSDVPFFLNGPTALAGGRGERLTPIVHHTPAWLVLAKLDAGLSTPRVYADLRAPSLTAETHHAPLPETRAMIQGLQQGNLEAVARALRNDLEGPALRLMPELTPLRERMLRAGCLGVLMTGSGSAIVGVCADEATAHHAARDLSHDTPWTWVGPWVMWR